jgi:alkaline phosphatase
MEDLLKTTIIIFSTFVCAISAAQVKKYTPSNGHAHNDYLNAHPFHTAYSNGFGSIEADVYPVNDVLQVAHHKAEIKPANTLSTLYIKPLLEQLSSGKARNVNLLVDIKENYSLSLSLLVKELQPLLPYLSTPAKPNYLSIVISGSRPPPSEYKNYPDFIFFDDDLKAKHEAAEWNRVRLVSLPFTKISTWKGDNKPAKEDRKRLAHIIDSTHAAGKPIRFWAAPDTRASWKWQKRLKADLIGTDKVTELAEYLK